MPTAKKEANVAELKELVANSTILISAEYRGLTVKELTTLRRQLRDAGVEVRVVKNRLFQLAAKQAGVELAGGIAAGPSMIVFGSGDIIAPAKAIADYIKTARNSFAATGAFMDGVVHPASIVAELASLPSRDELIGKLVAVFISPVQTFATLMNDSIQTFARLVDARASQLEEQAA